MGLVVLFAVAAQSLTIHGPSSCPSPEAVAKLLAATQTLEAPRARQVEIRTDAERLLLTLKADDQVETVRALPLSSSCEEMAEAASVVIASWLADAPSVEPGAFVLPSPHLKVERLSVTRAPSPNRSKIAYDLGVAFVAAFAPAFAPGASVDIAVTRAQSRFAARASIWGTSTRSTPLGLGHADFLRVGLSVGARYRAIVRRLSLEAHADFTFALLRAQGAGYDVAHLAYNFDPGLGGGVRLGVRMRRVTPFVGVDFTGWLVSQEVAATGVATTTTLPRWDLLLSTGISFGNI